jgi:hypothetical protein
LVIGMVNVPLYCGVPSLLHQFPLAAVVEVEVVETVVLVVGVDLVVVEVVVVAVVVLLVVVVVELVPHDASSIAVTNSRLRLNQITLPFNVFPPFLLFAIIQDFIMKTSVARVP